VALPNVLDALSRDPKGVRVTASHEHVREDAHPEDEQSEIRSILQTLRSGTVIDGKYRVDHVLGRGAMGVVVAATHLQLGEHVALKFLRIQNPTADQDFQSRFRREARLSARLKSEHITRVIDVGVWREKVPFMVMEYLVGGDLRALTRWTGPLPLDIVLDFAIQICSGIAVAHALGAVHRDLKSSNVFVTQRPDGSPLLKILDFGISKWGTEPESIELTKTGVVLGSPKYMAPEQLFGSAEVDARADVWSVGAIIYEMLTGKPPYDVPTVMRVCAVLSTNEMPPALASVRSDVPDGLEAALFKCFARNPVDRVQNVGELAGALLEAAGAPGAAAMKQRILATLDPSRATRDPLLSTTGAHAAFSVSGAFSTIGATTASISSSSSSAARRVSGSGPTTRAEAPNPSTSAALAPAEEPKPRRRALPWIVLGIVVAAIAAAFALHRTGEHAATSAPSAAPSAPPTAEPTGVSTAATAATPAIASATATAPTPDAAPTHRAGAAPHATATPKAKPSATSKEPTATAAPPPVTAPPPPPPAPKGNPLEERQ
jgi:serine/threonine-protein kinase